MVRNLQQGQREIELAIMRKDATARDAARDGWYAAMDAVVEARNEAFLAMGAVVQAPGVVLWDCLWRHGLPWAVSAPLNIDYGDTPLGRRMTRDSEHYLGTARGMPNSEARKRLEEREQTCVICGHTGTDVHADPKYLKDLCDSVVACRDRVYAARACLKPVTQV